MQIRYSAENITCARCAEKIETSLASLPGVEKAKINFPAQRLTLSLAGAEDSELLEKEILRRVTEFEPEAKLKRLEPSKQNTPSESSGRRLKPSFIRLAVSATGWLAALLLPVSAPVRALLFIAVMLLCGYRIFLSSLRSLLRFDFSNENLLMTIAASAASVIGEFAEGAAVIILFSFGELLQETAVRRSRANITRLLSLKPDYANLESDDGVNRVAPGDVKRGDVIRVLPGERIPLDGVIISGTSSADTSALTGESLPRELLRDSEVFAGYINLSGLVRVRVTGVSGETQADRILEMVMSASERKAKSERFISRFARYYTPSVIAAALLVALVPPLLAAQPFSLWLHRALVLLVIACPCALVLSVPLGFFAGIGTCAKRGILVKGGNILESLAHARAAAFDKTGTLTRGVFEVTSLVPAPGFNAEDLREAALFTQSFSSHPLSRAVLHHFGESSVPQPPVYEEFPGLGVRSVTSEGVEYLAGSSLFFKQRQIEAAPVTSTSVHFAKDMRYTGHIELADTPKSDSAEAIQSLRRLGITDIAMLSGDSRRAAQQTADMLGIRKVHAELLPGEKLKLLEKLRSHTDGNIIYTGDGINDAPVLARADIGIAMGSLGSDIAVESADVVLVSDEPSKVAEAVRIARRTRLVVMQNIVFSISFKFIVMLLGVFGAASMWLAVIADVGVSLLAVLNSLRIFGGKQKYTKERKVQ